MDEGEVIPEKREIEGLNGRTFEDVVEEEMVEMVS